MKLERTNYSSGAPLEEKVGYSRMVKIGPYIKIGGTTSVQPDSSVYGKDAYEQTKYILDKQIKLLEQAGASTRTVDRIKLCRLMAFATGTSEGYVKKIYTERHVDTSADNCKADLDKLRRLLADAGLALGV